MKVLRTALIVCALLSSQIAVAASAPNDNGMSELGARGMPSSKDYGDVDRGALLCPYWALVEIRTLQKRCHPSDLDFAQKLDKSIQHMESFLLAKKWVSQKLINEEHMSFHLLDRNKCGDEAIERPYRIYRRTVNEYDSVIANLLANPPTMKHFPYQTPCL